MKLSVICVISVMPSRKKPVITGKKRGRTFLERAFYVSLSVIMCHGIGILRGEIRCFIDLVSMIPGAQPPDQVEGRLIAPLQSP